MHLRLIGKTRKVLAALVAACHLLAFSAAPLLHTCDLASSRCLDLSASARPGSAACGCGTCPVPWQGCSCRLPGLCRTVCAAGAPEIDSKDDAVVAPADVPALAGGPCLACLYLQGSQSGSPFDIKPAAGPAETSPACRTAVSDVCPWPVLFDYPARAPPAAS